MGLQPMPKEQRLAILKLAFPGVGAVIEADLHPGMRYFLKPYVDRKPEGSSFLRDAHQRQIIRVGCSGYVYTHMLEARHMDMEAPPFSLLAFPMLYQ